MKKLSHPRDQPRPEYQCRSPLHDEHVAALSACEPIYGQPRRSIIGNSHLSAIVTLVERHTPMVRLAHLPRVDSDFLHAALVTRTRMPLLAQ